MALRLQSNLLYRSSRFNSNQQLLTSLFASYGVSRVYSQQCGYVLTDAQTAQSNMRQLLKSLRTSELDLEAGKARYYSCQPRLEKEISDSRTAPISSLFRTIQLSFLN